ncbi:hypothetical protein DYL59_27195 [Pseudomonas kairouanensis]|uniref:Uncharacterized protein n=1 Tax=Pseudomonas kairouanensis TaxID=2293832 RepID=A0A4Z0AE26_9PSED|nr:hypothetical protein DYL59_27195 [Pseudomonas kairouanensis]
MAGDYIAQLTPSLVGASLLAKSPRAPRVSRIPALSLTPFASKLAPTRAWRPSTPQSPKTPPD